MNHATAHKHYSYESWLRIWNPELFHILTRGPFFSLLRTETEPGDEGGFRPADGCCKGRHGHALAMSLRSKQQHRGAQQHLQLGSKGTEQSAGNHGGSALQALGVERASQGWRGVRKALACVSTSTAGRGEGSGRAAEEEGAHSGMDATQPRRVRPLRHFTEHVSSSKVA